MDPFGRVIDYLRISVTDRCNERCLYCMPEGYKGWARKPDHLTAREFVEIVQAAARLGFRKFRLTGGEPLLRDDLVEIVRGIDAIPGAHTIGLSTNGTRLAPVAVALKEAGLRSVNISLDALSPDIYRRITGGSLDSVLAGIEAARAAGFESVKLNCVLMRGMNEGEIPALADFAARHRMPLRLIELMPLTRADVLDKANFLSISEGREILETEGPLEPLPDYRPGHGPARYFLHKPTGARIGLIGALTHQDFCADCNKLRLTADGKIRPCLGRHGEIDIRRGVLEEGLSLDALLQQAIANKPENHEFSQCYEPGRPMTAIGG